jgi:O-antigen ligase
MYRGGAFKSLLVFPFAILLTLSLLWTEPTRRNLERILLGFFVLVACFSSTILFRDVEQGWRLTTGGMYDPNDLAAMVALTIPVGLGTFLRARGDWVRRAWLAAGLLVLFLVIVQTSSRGGILAILAGVVTFVVAQRLGRKLWLGAALVMIGLGLWFGGPAAFRDRANSLLHLDEDYNTTSVVGRKEIWKRGITHTLNHPVFGVGMSNFAEAEGRTFQEAGFEARWFTAHNTFVQAFAELGFPGGLILVAMLGLAAVRSFRLWRAPRGRGRLWYPELLASLAAFCTSGFFLSHAYAYLLFGLLAMIALAERARRASAGA